jgi:hypothetical protein
MGYFDPAEREFRGFARVERSDTEQFASFALPLAPGESAPENAIETLHAPPVQTVAWHHTGAAFEAGATLASRLAVEFYAGDPQAPQLPPDDVDTADAPAEAYRALKGAVLRTEIYAHDGSAREAHPYAVECHAFEVRALQQRGDRPAAVFLRVPRESLALRYEREPADPRVVQTLNLESTTSEISHTASPLLTRGAARRRNRSSGARRRSSPRRASSTRPPACRPIAPQHRVGVACENRSYEITHADQIALVAGTVRPAAFVPFIADLDDFVPTEAEPAAPAKRLLNWTRMYFRADAAAAAPPAPDRFDGRLALGDIELLGLPFESRRAVLTPGCARSSMASP